MARLPLYPRQPERVCWGCDRYCRADDLVCGNGFERAQHPIELFGPDWLEWADGRRGGAPDERYDPPVSFLPASFPLQTHLGMTLDCPQPGRATARLEVTEALKNPNGVLHGAALFALVDTGMGAATMSVLPAGQACASIEVHLRFLAPCQAGEVVAEAEVLRQGKRIVQLECRVRDGRGQLVAVGTGSFAVVRPAAEPSDQ